MSTGRHLALVPRDGLACRDGRGWAPVGAGRAHALDWPWPSTILGALRTAWGRGVEAREGRRFGPQDWLDRTREVRLGRLLVLKSRSGEVGWQSVWPRPLDATAFEGATEIVRLDPVPPALPTLGRDEDPARGALWRPAMDDLRKPATLPAWWPDEAFCAWLQGAAVSTRELTLGAPERRVQIHVGIRAETLTAEEGRLFSEDVLETVDRSGRWAIGAELEAPDPPPCGVATLGADKRLAAIEPLGEQLFAPPEDLLAAFRPGSRGLRLLVVTPACFAGGWLVDGFRAEDAVYRGSLPGVDGEVVLRAAFVGRPLAVSGWDLVTGRPKRTDRMVPPGSVFFVERADGRPFDAEDARKLWLSAIGGRTEEGFGRIVPGIWHPSRPDPC
ncbi:MAG: type III-B CRISPR module-associated protein Cmr3 [Geminicoccaceae bacterium]|nr:type III-B CRISPR module-associated protein Cmr3 [Geminicoccaceae bacterium]